VNPITIGELRLLHTLIEHVAIHDALADDDIVADAEVTIDVPGDEFIRSPWILFTIADKPFAILRSTGALFTVDEHGAVSDDPIHQP
jgi:hypothetical protein